jgi:hypothetical protein
MGLALPVCDSVIVWLPLSDAATFIGGWSVARWPARLSDARKRASRSLPPDPLEFLPQAFGRELFEWE